MNIECIHLPQDPLFIVGYPRSGTTLLQALLAAHPHVYTFPETHFFSNLEKHVLTDEYGFIQAFRLNHALSLVCHKLPFHINLKERAALYCLAHRRGLTSKKLFEWIVYKSLLAIQNYYPQRPFTWIEKTPLHYNHLQKIISFYPEARILAILRHPVPAISSRKNKFPFNKETQISTLANGWKSMISILENFQNEHPASIRIIRYEDLTRSPYKELRRMDSFLSIPIKKKCLKHYYRIMSALILPFETWKQDQKYTALSNTNPDHSGLITQVQVEEIESILHSDMKKYGYFHFNSRRTP
jgi:hypothetical protein